MNTLGIDITGMTTAELAEVAGFAYCPGCRAYIDGDHTVNHTNDEDSGPVGVLADEAPF